MTSGPTCPSSGKVQHASAEAARKTATAVGNRRTHARPRVYQCPTCHAWHLTTAPRQRQPGEGRRRRGRGDPGPPPVATREELDAWFAQHTRPKESS